MVLPGLSERLRNSGICGLEEPGLPISLNQDLLITSYFWGQETFVPDQLVQVFPTSGPMVERLKDLALIDINGRKFF